MAHTRESRADEIDNRHGSWPALQSKTVLRELLLTSLLAARANCSSFRAFSPRCHTDDLKSWDGSNIKCTSKRAHAPYAEQEKSPLAAMPSKAPSIARGTYMCLHPDPYAYPLPLSLAVIRCAYPWTRTVRHPTYGKRLGLRNGVPRSNACAWFVSQ